MKTLFRVTFFALFSLFLNAQTINIHTNDGSVYQIEIATIDSITFQETASVSQNIDGVIGGIIEYNRGIINTEGKVVQVDAKLEIPANAFDGNQIITINFNIDSGYISFTPDLVFSTPCVLNFGLIGLDLAKLGFTSADNAARFVFIDDTGAIFPVSNQSVTFNFVEGVLQVTSAQIKHFSRYGFVR
jgi:hypothetical protein